MKPAPYPIALLLEGQSCLVVGGGRVAARKALALAEAGAEVTVIAPTTTAEIDAVADRVLRRRYRTGDVAGYRLVMTATGRPSVDAAVFADAEAAGVLVNAADNTEACRFFVPAVVRRGPVTVAVSTGGTSPYLASWLRQRLSDVVGPEIGDVAVLLGQARSAIRAAAISTEDVRWSEILDDELVAVVASGRTGDARRRVEAWQAAQIRERR